MEQLSVKGSLIVSLFSLCGWTKVCTEDLRHTVVPQAQDDTLDPALNIATSVYDPHLAKQTQDRGGEVA